MARDVKIAILGDSKDFSRAVKSANDDAEKLTGSLDRTRSGFGKLAAGAAIGVAGIGVAAYAISGLISEATEAEKVTKQTEAVIKSMGGASKVSADQVAELAQQLSEKTGIDDELIQSGQNVLLTFGKVRNEAGKGNKIFDRATKSALDMSVALGTDLKSANIQVGKALNDPVKGITALTRAGVSFTQKQKDQVKALVESGDQLGAQKIILSELEKEFSGSAEAQATAGDKLKVVWGNLQEDLGARLLPAFSAVADWASVALPAALDFLSGAFAPVQEVIGEFWSTLTTGEGDDTAVQRAALAVRDAFDEVKDWLDENGPTIRKVVGNVFSSIIGFATFAAAVIRDVILPRLVDFGAWFFDNGPGLEIVISGIAAALGVYAVNALVAAAGTIAMIAPFLLVAAAAGILIWATDQLIEKFSVDLSNAIQWVIDHVIVPLKNAIEGVVGAIQTALDLLDKLPGDFGKGGGGGAGIDLFGAITKGTPFGPVLDKLPFADSGGVWPGPRGVHSLGWVAGGETLLPTHKAGWDGGSSGDINVTVMGNMGRDELRDTIYQLKKIRVGAAA